MEKLMKPAEYAQELGISRQAVYAKIKRGILNAKSVEGKLYIVVDNIVQKHKDSSTVEKSSTTVSASVSSKKAKDYESLLKAKDETISVLKGTVKDLKKSNKQISTTLKGEIDLLKDAFHEMRSLYMLQLEQKRVNHVEETIEVFSEEESESVDVEVEKWITLKKFFKIHKVAKPKKQDKIIKRIKKAYKLQDERFMIVKNKLKLNANKMYEDILN